MSDQFGPAMLSVTTGIQAFYSLLPRLSDVRKADPVNNPDVAADVRLGEVGATALTLGVGAIASSLTQSPLPAITGLLMALVLVGIYESALRSQKPFERHAQAPIRLLRPEEVGLDA